MPVRFSSKKPPLPGDTVLIRYSLGPGPFTVASVIHGFITFTDRPNGWQLHPGIVESGCELYSRNFQYDPSQTGDTDDDI